MSVFSDNIPSVCVSIAVFHRRQCRVYQMTSIFRKRTTVMASPVVLFTLSTSRAGPKNMYAHRRSSTQYVPRTRVSVGNRSYSKDHFFNCNIDDNFSFVKTNNHMFGKNITNLFSKMYL